jgi:FMN phosphatase YigB (HAD superfamily)
MSAGAMPSSGGTSASVSPHAAALAPPRRGESQAAPAIAGVVFDVPDVLYDATAWRRWLLQLVSRLGVRIGYAAFCDAWDAHLIDVYRGRREFSEALQTFLLDFGLSWPQIDEIEAASRIQRQDFELNVRPLPGVARAVEELAAVVPLVAWADAPYPAARLAERLARLVPRVPFTAVLTSFDIESTQPADRCYRAMVEALGGHPSGILYVGHDAVHLAAARQAGLRAIAFNFGPGTEADHYLTRFEDLPRLVKQLAAVQRPDALPSSGAEVRR